MSETYREFGSILLADRNEGVIERVTQMAGGLGLVHWRLHFLFDHLLDTVHLGQLPPCVQLLPHPLDLLALLLHLLPKVLDGIVFWRRKGPQGFPQKSLGLLLGLFDLVLAQGDFLKSRLVLFLGEICLNCWSNVDALYCWIVLNNPRLLLAFEFIETKLPLKEIFVGLTLLFVATHTVVVGEGRVGHHALVQQGHKFYLRVVFYLRRLVFLVLLIVVWVVGLIRLITVVEEAQLLHGGLVDVEVGSRNGFAAHECRLFLGALDFLVHFH